MPDLLGAYGEGLRAILRDGGAVMPVLIGLAVVLWYGLTVRALTLRRWLVADARARVELASRAAPRSNPRRLRSAPRGGPRNEASAARRDAQRALARAKSEGAGLARLVVAPLEEELVRGKTLIASLVVAAPLLGLLGTVSGMIETFDALGQAALFRAGGGIAGGIAEALLTTQIGLCIAVPGLVLGRLLDRREAALRADVEALWAS